jgi:zinc transporter 5/7
VALEITLESVERMMEPPDLTTEGLLAVSILGFVVNVIGLLCCHEAHEHGHGHSPGLPGGDSSDSDSDDGCGHEDHNMRAIFLHILADTLGSASVIVSFLCIKYLGWNWADPVASLFISICCVASVLPLVGQTASLLLLSIPPPKAAALGGCMQRVRHLPGVAAVSHAHFWCHTPGELCGAVQLTAAAAKETRDKAADCAAIASQARAIYSRVRLSSLAVEVIEEPRNRGVIGGGVSIAMAGLLGVGVSERDFPSR